MTIIEALKELETPEKREFSITRSAWQDVVEILTSSNCSPLWIIAPDKQHAGCWNPTPEDLLAHDWQLLGLGMKNKATIS